MQERFQSYIETRVAEGFSMAEARPLRDLSRAVLRYQGFESYQPMAFSDRVHANLFLPFIVNFGEQWDIASGDRDPTSFDSFTAGLIDRYTHVTSNGRPACLQMDLTPFGARALFGQPLHILTGTVVDLGDILGQPFADLADQLASQKTWRARLELADSFVRTRLRQAELPERRTVAAWRMMHLSGGRARVSAIADRLDISREHLSRMFREQIGHSPKAVSRIIRFQRAISLAPQLRFDWSAVAHDTGYADQAHLVREFGQMTGETPTRWAASHSFNTPSTEPENVG